MAEPVSVTSLGRLSAISDRPLTHLAMSYLQLLLLICLALSASGYLSICKRPRPRLLTIGLVGLLLLSWPPAEWLFSRPLEIWYPLRLFRASPPLEAIVVLGGSNSPPIYERPYPLTGRDTFENLSMAAWLHTRFSTIPVLAAEGFHQPTTYPSTMYQFLKNVGVPENLIWFENQSHNTHENALYSAAILRTHRIQRIALVTDAQSMPRAYACFRKLGFHVLAAPSAFSTLKYQDLLPNWHAIQGNERTLHEILGFIWYWMRGWV